MAKYTVSYFDDGSYQQSLTFCGKKYICRATPFVDGVSRALDRDLDYQVEDDYPGNEELIELVCGIADGFEDGQFALPKLKKLEAMQEQEAGENHDG